MYNLTTSIVILNYNNAIDTIKCVNLVEKFLTNVDVILVDNNSTDNSQEILMRTFHMDSQVDLVFSEKNTGYAGGNNIGIKKALQKQADYICVLNNDVVIDNDFLQPLIEQLQNDDEIGVVGPCVLNGDNVVNTGNEINFLSISFSHGLNSGVPHKSIMDKKINCDFLTGACLVFRSDIINSVGMLPEAYFLNYEETEWCWKIREAGYKVVCYTSSTIYHEGEKSINKVNGMQVYFLRRNIVLFEIRNAKFLQKCIFFPKLFIWSILQTIYHLNFNAAKAYCDGITGRNRFNFLRK